MSRTRTPAIIIVAFVAFVAFTARGTDGPVERSSTSLAPGEQVVAELNLADDTSPSADYAR